MTAPVPTCVSGALEASTGGFLLSPAPEGAGSALSILTPFINAVPAAARGTLFSGGGLPLVILVGGLIIAWRSGLFG